MAKLLGNQFVEDLPGPGTRLMQSLIATQQRREDRERRKALDAIAEEERQRMASLEEEQRQIRALEFAQKMAALQEPEKRERPQTFEESSAAAVEQGMAPIPDTPEERAAFASAPQQMVSEAVPSRPVQATVGGREVSVPMLNRAELQTRADEDFQTKLDQARKLEVAKGATELTPEIITGMPKELQPFFQSGQLMTPPNVSSFLAAEARDQDIGNPEPVVIDGQEAMATPQEIAQAKATGKSVTPYSKPPELTGGMTPRQSVVFNQIAAEYGKDPIIVQGDKAKAISKMADNIIANPNDPMQQLSAMYLYVKNLDSDSAVRAEEQKLLQLTQSYWSTWGNELARALGEGRVLNPKAATDAAKATKQLAEAWAASSNARSSRARARALVSGVGPQFDQYLSETVKFSDDGGQNGAGLSFNTRAELEAAIKSGQVKSGDIVTFQGKKRPVR